AGGTTLVGVDATRIHKVKEFREAFRIVVWNFPHMGAGEKDVEKSIEKHRQLLAEFFASAVHCLDSSPSAAIHVALKAGEPYKSWKIVQVAKAASGGTLQLSGVSPFSLAAWP
ncbi:bmt5, partial [Symbiodinium sp. KB8]